MPRDHGGFRQPLSPAIAIVGVLVIGWWLYRPDAPRSFDLIDFPVTLELLQRNDGLLARVQAYTSTYLAEGRFNPVAYLAMAAQWSLFGLHVRAWQVARFGIMSAIVVCGYLILRRMGMTRTGAMTGAAAYVLAPTATRGWSWLTSAEPLGTLLILGATAVTLASNPTSRRRRLGAPVLVATLLALAVLTKEMLAAGCLIPALVAWAVGRMQTTVESRRHAGWLVLAGWAGVAIALVPVAYAYLQAPAEAYATRYASAGIAGVDLIGSFWSAAVPFAPLPGTLMLGIVLVGYVGLSVFGWALLARSGAFATRRLLSVGLGLPALGMLAYAPWPSYSIGYALPFLFGGAVLVAGAVTGLQRASRPVRLLSMGFGALLLAYAASGVLVEVRPPQALLSAIRPLLPLVHMEAKGDPVVVGANDFQMERPIAAFAYRFSQLARANGVGWPATRSVTCEEASSLARSDSTVLVVRVSEICPSPGNAYRSIDVSYRLFDWRTFRVSRHHLQMELARAGRTP